jgi:hypothetical protein
MPDGSDKQQVPWPCLPVNELVDELKGQERGWWSAGERRGYWQLLRLMYAQSQGMDPSGAPNATQQLQIVGRNAKFVRFRVQLTRSHIKQRNIMAQGERPAFQCLALNDDFASLAQVPTAQTGIDYVYRAAKGEQCEWRALESDGYFGEGFIWGRWDYAGGVDIVKTTQEPVTDETGQPVMWPGEPDPQTGQMGEPQPATRDVQKKQKAGTPTLTPLFPWDVVRDPYARESSWIMVRDVCSKYAVAARYGADDPEKYKNILATNNLRAEAGIAEMFAYDVAATTTDQVIVRHWYHERCEYLPEGRYVGVCGDEVLWDEPNPLPQGNPVVSICSARYFGTQFGYPECSDLLAVQEMLDELWTQGANNILRYGNQSLWAEDGVEVDMKKLAEGGGFFNYKTGQQPPQAIQWAGMPPLWEKMTAELPELMNLMSGMNSVARGAPESNIESGAFAALMLNIAQKFVSSTEQSLEQARNDVGNMLLAFLHANADTEFVGLVAGENQAPYLRTFKGTEFGGIQRVQVSTASPLSRTIPGRFELISAIKDIPDKRDKAAAYQFLNTGSSTAFSDPLQSEKLLIQWENEQLMQGIWVEPASCDDPVQHNEEHKAMVNKLRTMPPTDDQQEMALREKGLQTLLAHMSKQALVWAMGDPIFMDSLKLPRPAMPANPFGTLPVQGMPETGSPGGAPQTPGADLTKPDGGLPKPAKSADPPQNAPQQESATAAPAS